MYKKILIINPFGIGDVLFTTPIIHTLKDAFPGVKIGYLCNRRSAPLLENNPYIDSLFVYERDEFEVVRQKSFFAWLRKIFIFLKQIKKEHFDLAIDLSLNTQYSFFSWYGGIKKRIGYDYKGRGWLLTKKVKLKGYCDKHIVEYYTGLLGLIDLNLGHKDLELYLNQKDIAWTQDFLSKQGMRPEDLLVVIIPGAGASWGKDAYLKQWPQENFTKLCDKIIENYKAKIIIMGDFSEKELVKKVVENMRYKAIDLSGVTNLSEFAALLSKANLVITNDGGPLHIAVALGKNTVSFFGPVDPKVYGPYPYDENCHIVLRKDLDCSPCYHNFRLDPCLLNRQCLETINAEEALEAVGRLLRG